MQSSSRASPKGLELPERRGLHRLLELSWVYSGFQRLIIRSGAADTLRAELYPELGERPLRVLDIGCGPAAFWDRYKDLGQITYIGIEPNKAYVDVARLRFPDIELHVGQVREVGASIDGTFDLVVLEGVLHHIDDETAREVLAFGAEKLKQGGRLVALDTAFVPRQNPIARVLARLDRGKNVRTLNGYRELATDVFPEEQVRVRCISGELRVPYDYSVLTCGSA